MRNVFREEAALFISVIKWVVIATLIGAIVGLSTAAFLKMLDFATKQASSYHYYFLFLPVALVITTIIVTYLSPDAAGHGTEKVIEAIHKHAGRIKPSVVPVKLLATVITLAGGGSAGKEGPCAQIGAGLASIFADILKFDDDDRKKLVICGISAGFASVFGTPIAGAIFGVEVLYAGIILYEVLLPSFIAGITSYHVTKALGITFFHYSLSSIPAHSEAFFVKLILAGIFFGLCSLLLIETMNRLKKFADGIHLPKLWKAIIGGFVLVVLTLIFSNQYLGLGIQTIQSALEGGKIVWYAFLLKIIFTSITLNFGGSGGIITPIFFVGATSGVVFANLFGLDRATFSAFGLVALLAGAANTPVSASIMSMELFGTNMASYASIACVTSFVMTGHRSVYPSQVLAIKKSRSIEVETGKEVETAKPRLKLRRKSLFDAGFRIYETIRKKTNREK